MNECLKEKKRAYLAVGFLLINVLIIIFITKYVNLGMVSVYGLFIAIYFLKVVFSYIDCVNE